MSQYKGTFTAKNTPEGEIVYQINNNGGAAWYYTSDLRHAGIGFMVANTTETTEKRNFVLFDCWAGSVTSENVLIMSGSRSYTKNKAHNSLFTFDNIKFTRK